MLEDMVSQAGANHIVRKRSLERACAHEVHNRMEARLGQIERQSQGIHVQFVLEQWILELGLESTFQALGPAGVAFRAEDPTTVILGFNDEDAVNGDHHMIELRGAIAVGPWEVQVLVYLVSFAEPGEHQAVYGALTDEPLDCGFEHPANRRKGSQQDQDDEPRHHRR